MAKDKRSRKDLIFVIHSAFLSSSHINIKQQLLFLLCATCFRPKPLFNPPFTQVISCEDEDIRFLTNTTFNVIYLNMKDKQGFFRECKRHVEKRAYVNEIIYDYFNDIAKDSESKKIKNIVLESLKNKNNFNKFFNMGIVNDPKSPVANFMRSRNVSLIGLKEASSAKGNELLYNFVQYSWGEIYTYRLNSGVKDGAFQNFNSSKSYSTKIVADLIGAGDLIPPIEYVLLKIKGQKERFGTFMAEATGVPPCCLSYQIRQNISPEFQRQCSNLNILDVLCYEKDHRPGNYYVTVNPYNTITNLQAFDNDSPMAFFPTNRISFPTYLNCSSILNNAGFINRPYLDKKVVERISKLEYKDVLDNLGHSLTGLQIIALWKRILRIKKAIKETQTIRPLTIDPNDWSQSTIQEELSGKFGNTYLITFCTSSR